MSQASDILSEMWEPDLRAFRLAVDDDLPKFHIHYGDTVEAVERKPEPGDLIVVVFSDGKSLLIARCVLAKGERVIVEFNSGRLGLFMPLRVAVIVRIG